MDYDQLQADGAQEPYPVPFDLPARLPAEVNPDCPDCVGPLEDWKYHAECGFAWSVHDNTNVLNDMPFGCPSETTARLRWGR